MLFSFLFLASLRSSPVFTPSSPSNHPLLTSIVSSLPPSFHFLPSFLLIRLLQQLLFTQVFPSAFPFLIFHHSLLIFYFLVSFLLLLILLVLPRILLLYNHISMSRCLSYCVFSSNFASLVSSFQRHSVSSSLVTCAGFEPSHMYLLPHPSFISCLHCVFDSPPSTCPAVFLSSAHYSSFSWFSAALFSQYSLHIICLACPPSLPPSTHAPRQPQQISAPF